MAYLNAKKPATTKPGIVMMIDNPAIRDKDIAKRAQAIEATMNNRMTDFVKPTLLRVTNKSIKVVF
jgi:hypothetical protein